MQIKDIDVVDSLPIEAVISEIEHYGYSRDDNRFPREEYWIRKLLRDNIQRELDGDQNRYSHGNGGI